MPKNTNKQSKHADSIVSDRRPLKRSRTVNLSQKDSGIKVTKEDNEKKVQAAYRETEEKPEKQRCGCGTWILGFFLVVLAAFVVLLSIALYNFYQVKDQIDSKFVATKVVEFLEGRMVGKFGDIIEDTIQDKMIQGIDENLDQIDVNGEQIDTDNININDFIN